MTMEKRIQRKTVEEDKQDYPKYFVFTFGISNSSNDMSPKTSPIIDFTAASLPFTSGCKIYRKNRLPQLTLGEGCGEGCGYTREMGRVSE